MVCPHEQGGRGVEPVRTFYGAGQFFAILYGRPLMSENSNDKSS